MSLLDEYRPIVGSGVIEDLSLLAERLNGRTVQHISAASVGGSAAEILHRVIPLLRELGVSAHWNMLKGGEQFSAVTAKLHRLLRGAIEVMSRDEWQVYDAAIEQNARELDLGHDITIIHDTEPLGLIRNKHRGKWVWRSHQDLSRPDHQIWQKLIELIRQYDAAVFSAPSYAPALDAPQVLIPPSIDPLSDRSRDIDDALVEETLTRFGIDPQVSTITQISNFTREHDPLGVIEAFKLARKYVDCQLVLAGETDTDDPESTALFAALQDKAQYDPHIHIIALSSANHLAMNSVLKASTVVVQRSLHEGFSNTVSEALWKAKPVIASAVGGIPLQITHKFSGVLTHTVEGTAYWIKQLLQSPEFAKRLGDNGREHIRQNYLITRQVKDYLVMCLSLYHDRNVICV